MEKLPFLNLRRIRIFILIKSNTKSNIYGIEYLRRKVRSQLISNFASPESLQILSLRAKLKSHVLEEQKAEVRNLLLFV